MVGFAISSRTPGTDAPAGTPFTNYLTKTASPDTSRSSAYYESQKSGQAQGTMMPNPNSGWAYPGWDADPRNPGAANPYGVQQPLGMAPPPDPRLQQLYYQWLAAQAGSNLKSNDLPAPGMNMGPGGPTPPGYPPTIVNGYNSDK